MLQLFRSKASTLPMGKMPVEVKPLVMFVSGALGLGIFNSFRKLKTDPDIRSHAASYLEHDD
ncbi:unnamed protein product [Absidia cylindrospora]